MIQRIQSVYLLVVTILMVICMCSPIGSIITNANEISELGNLCITFPDGTKDYSPWALFVILLVVAALSFVTIFLFKKRMLQIRLTIFSSVVLIGYYMALVAYLFMLAEDTTFSASWTICLPFAALILNWLAIRGIGADEALVKAYDRLR
ncbi:MAG: DUF4293 domain-containing protein [Bacteroides sp.]|nr:DUF4293 domain-containing protein [Bacteroides sp.]MBQ8874044.1 DUF4293 domain-containing protein [Bacteroides sp.]